MGDKKSLKSKTHAANDTTNTVQKSPPPPETDAANNNTTAQENTSKDFKQLWEEAIDQAIENNNNNPKNDKVQRKDLEEVIGDVNFNKGLESGAVHAEKLFEAKRHPGGTLDKLSTAVGGCLDWVIKAVDFTVAHVDGSYVAPAKVLAGAIKILVSAAKGVTEDLNKIQETFGIIKDALFDLGDLTQFTFDDSNFRIRLMNLFTGMLEFCLFSSDQLKKKHSKLRLLAIRLRNGANQAITDKCKEVEKLISDLRAIIPIAGFAETKAVREDVGHLKQTAENTDENVAEILHMTLESRFDEKNNTAAKLAKVIDTLRTYYDLNLESEKKWEEKRDEMEGHIVDGTFSWTQENQSYKHWLNGQGTHLLYIQGKWGTGKSFFAYHCYRSIRGHRKRAEMRKGRPDNVVAYFLFEPDNQNAQTFLSVLALILYQFALQNSKIAESMARDLENGPLKGNPDDRLNYLWDNILRKSFETGSESSHMAYILLDGVGRMEETERKKMFDRFRNLDPYGSHIHILMTGQTEDIMSEIGESYPKPEKIGLPIQSDIVTIITKRVEQFEPPNAFKPDDKEQIRKELSRFGSKHLNLSELDLLLNIIGQCKGKLADARDKIDESRTGGLYRAMIENILAQRGKTEKENVQRLFTLCTYAKRPLSIGELQQFVKPNSGFTEFDVLKEVQGKSSSLLYTKRRAVGEDPLSKADKEFEVRQSVVRFHVPVFKEYLANSDEEANKNEMIDNPLKSKVEIFVRLCAILCDSDSRSESLQEYATSYFIQHLRDINMKVCDASQCCDVVEALARVLGNDNNVSLVFERVMRKHRGKHVEFDLYETPSESPAASRHLDMLRTWAVKMSLHKDEVKLTKGANNWVEKTIKEPASLFEKLALGHLESWAKQVTVESAAVPYKLAYRALRTTGRLSENDPLPDADGNRLSHITKPLGRRILDATEPDEITSDIATKILQFGDRECFKTPLKRIRARIAAALLLNDSKNFDNRKAAKTLYNDIVNTSKTGPELFYSCLGLAEYYSKAADEEKGDGREELWEKALDYTRGAMVLWEDERNALGSELDNSRCTALFLCQKDAFYSLGSVDETLETCEAALKKDQLEYSNELCEFLTEAVKIHHQNEEWPEIIQMVKQQPSLLRSEWLLRRKTRFADKNDALRHAAVITRRVDFLVQILLEAIEYWRSKTHGLVPVLLLNYELAIIYRRDVRATKLALDTLNSMNEQYLKKGDSKLHPFPVSIIFMELVDILFENFSLTQAKSEKEKFINALNNLIKNADSSDQYGSLFRATAKLTLAKMQRACGNLENAKNNAKAAFSICIDDLEDSFGSNDSSAFRALSKVLYFADLEHDAKIALSLQHSLVNGAYEDYGGSAMETEEKKTTIQNQEGNGRFDKDLDSTDAKEKTTTAGEQTQTNGSATSPGNTDGENTALPPPGESVPPRGSGRRGHAHRRSQAMSSMDLTALTLAAPPTAPDQLSEQMSKEAGAKELVTNGKHGTALPDDGGDILPAASSDLKNPTDTSLTNGAVGDQAEDKVTSPSRTSNPVDAPSNEQGHSDWPTKDPTTVDPPDTGDPGDLIQGGGFECNGPCKNEFVTSWVRGARPYWHCLDCADVDLCSDCYETQLKYYKETKGGFWFKCCWDEHKFLRQPMEDWKGVKNGVIRIAQREKHFADWLETVKKRWERKMWMM